MALYMLDTETASSIIRGGIAHLDDRIAAISPDQVCISSITRAELLLGVRTRSEVRRLAQMVDLFLSRVQSLPWGTEAADRFAVLAMELVSGGASHSRIDVMVAAHASAVGATLVTSDPRRFAQVPMLALECWLTDRREESALR